jgi:TolB-like protein
LTHRPLSKHCVLMSSSGAKRSQAKGSFWPKAYTRSALVTRVVGRTDHESESFDPRPGADYKCAMPDNVIAFGPFSLDRSGKVLLRDGVPVETGQRGIALLKALIDAGGGTVTKGELMERAWPDVLVEEGNLTVQIAALRKALGAKSDGGAWIATVPRVGYRLAPATRPGEPMLPSLAVLPFQNLNADPEQAYFADGLVEDIITAFSRFRTFAVVARNSSFVYKDRAVDVRDAAKALGVRYVLEGSVRRTVDRVRVAAQLIDGETGAHLWAEKFDGTIADILDVQDSITDSVIGLVEPQIRRAEIQRARRKRPDNPHAYDLYLRALPTMQGGHRKQRDENDEALAMLHKAVDLDPGFAPALAARAWAHERRLTRGYPAPPDADDAGDAIAFAHRALAADPNDAIVLAIAGVLQVTIREDNETGLELIHRAAALNPNSLLVANLAGYAFFHTSNFDQSIVHYLRGKQLSPLGSDAVWSLNGIARSHLESIRFEDALIWANRALSALPEANASGYCLTAASLAWLGRIEEARAIARTAREKWPTLTIAEFLGSVGCPDGRDRYMAGGMLEAGFLPS